MIKLFSKWVALLAIGSSVAVAELPAEQLDFFEKRIRPVLVEHCYKCHSSGAEKIKGGLLLDSKEGMLKGGESGKPALVPRNPDGSLLIEALRYQNEDLQMPPKKAGGKLSESQIADFISWVNMGAPDPRVQDPKSNVQSFKPSKTHWAFQPVANPPLPPVKNKSWVRTPIDQFILARLDEKNLPPSPLVDKRTLIRRATFDLTGLPPSVEEVDLFLKDKSPDAFEKVVDRLLASPRYGERWGRYWLDVARFADTKGYVYGGREETKFIHSSAYRDWVVRALNEDVPYDKFLKLQIAADQVADADRDSLAAMGFLTLGRRFLGVVHDIIDDRIDVVMRGTQALTVGCARCHDHKFDPIPTKDYYSLYGVFAGGYEREVPLNAAAQPAKAYLDFETEIKKREEKFQAAFNAKREEQSKRFRAKTADYLVAVLNVEKLPSEVFYSFVQADDVNPIIVRQWNSYLLGTVKTFHPIWSPWHAYAALSTNEFSVKAASVISSLTNATQKINPLVEKAFAEKVPNSMRDVAETFGKILADVNRKWSEAADKKSALSKDEEELRQVLYAVDSPATIPAGAIVDMEWYFDEPTRVELSTLQAQIDQWIIQSPGAPPHAVILEDRTLQKNPRVFKRGNPVNKGEEVPRQFLEVLSGEKRKPFEKGSGRLELAEAIASKENPLTARVLVNRVWAHHFGNGLVRTPSDFGMRSEPPTHPELLDWLAHNFMENGWSIKKLHRQILLSAVYQQTSDSEKTGDTGSASPHSLTKVSLKSETRVTRPSESIDPENKLLWRMNRQRLDFESLRDSLLFTSGQLDLKMGGKAEDLFKPPFSKRRSIYGFIDRQFLPGALRVFDFANPDMHNPQRAETTVPQQALFFMNGPFVVEQARSLALKVTDLTRCEMPVQKKRLITPIPRKKTDEEKIREFYCLVFQREPTTRQVQFGKEFIKAAEAETAQVESTKKIPSAWQYGWGEFDEATKQIKNFQPLPYFTGDAWQGGKEWPDAQLGWAQLTARGGHAGNDLQHAVVRRWISPVDGSISIEGNIQHAHPEGHGVRAKIISSKKGLLGEWTLHNKSVDTKVENLEVKQSDTIDFLVSIHESLNNNDFLWVPVIRMVGPKAIRDDNGYAKEWHAQKEFSGSTPEDQTPLTAW
ncbi:MAG: PSD1 and planctomycete cytochrome C domain-containing protein, partial [Verrucomicrobiota bacterium]